VSFCRFSAGENFLGILEMPGAPQKPKWAAATITKLAQKLAKIANNQIENKTLPPFPRIPTMANEGSLDCSDRNMEGIGGRTQGWENF
jgi:hypothetical protein